MRDDAKPAAMVAISRDGASAGPYAEAPSGLGVGASLALHTVFLVLAVSVALSPRSPPAERPVSVEILTPEQFDAMTAPRDPTVTPTPTPVPAPKPRRSRSLG